MKALIDAGANVNYVKPGTHLTALHWAAFNDDRFVVSYLMSQGALMYYSNNDETPLDIAGLCENYEVLQ